MANQQRTRTVYRLPPCPRYDVERMESWLGDMARQGLFLQKEGIAWGVVRFQPGEPKEVEYRLVSRRKPQMLWKRFLFGNPEEYLDGPKEEEEDLFAQFGWVYLSKCGNFFVYQAEGEQVFEVDSDPQVQAISIQAVRDQEITSLVLFLIDTAIIYSLNSSWSLFTILTRGWLPYFIPLLLPLPWLFFLLLLQVCTLDRLRRKLARGVPLDHRKPWRHRSGLHFLKCAGSLLVALAFVGSWAYAYSGDIYVPSEYFDVREYPGDPPFATVADLAPPGEYRLNHSHFSSGVTVWSNKLVPVYISWCEKADVTTDDGSVFTAALCVEYYELENEWLAKGLLWGCKKEGKQLAKRQDSYEVLSLPELPADYTWAYVDAWDHPALLVRVGSKVLQASLEQTGDCQLSLEEWTAQMVEAIQ